MRYAIFRSLFIILIIFVCSCNDEAIITPLDDIIEFNIEDHDHLVAAKLLKADGTTQIKLIAKLPKEAAEANRTVKFKTTDGTFNVSDADKSQCTVYSILPAGSNKLQATALLTLGTKSGKYTITASINGKDTYKVDIVIDVLPLNVTDFIGISIEDYDQLVASGKLKADGLTRIKVTATLPLTIPDADKQIEFKTTDGAFDVADANKLTKTVPAVLQNAGDTKLQASAYLTLGTNAGNYTISANIKGKDVYKVDKTLTVLSVKASDVLQVTFDPAAVRADGVSVVKIAAAITGIVAAKLAVSTTDGMLLNSADPKNVEIATSSDGKASAFLQAGTEVKNYVVTVKVPNSAYSQTYTYALLRAYPDQLILEPGQLSLNTDGGSISLNIFLKRQTGKVSNGTSVMVKAYQINDDGTANPVGRFTGTNNTSDNDGKIAILFFADSGPVNKTKPIFIEVVSQKDDGSLLNQKIQVTLK